MAFVSWLIAGVGVYLALGVVFAVPFAVAWAGRLSAAARGTGWGFRVLIVPGAAALWPVLAWRLLRERSVGAGGAGR